MNETNLLVYDNLQVVGGAEIVTQVIHQSLPFPTILVNSSNKSVEESLNIKSTSLKTLTNKQLSGAALMLSSVFNFWKYRDNNSYDTVIVSGIFAPLIAPRIKAKKIIYYCHTPPRFLFDLKDHYKTNLNKLQWILLRLFSTFYEPRYRESLKHIHTIIANSKNVQERLKKYLNVESEVIYPPCDTSYEGKESRGYFLSTARLEPYKRVDVIIDAFKEIPNKKLIVMSGGSLYEQLKASAQGYENIEFTGWVTEEQKRELIAHCEATIYIPKDEDFGMSPVESISAGKPVIGVAEGGILETILPGKNGILIPSSPLEHNLRQSIKHLDSKSFNMQTEANRKFNISSYKEAINAAISK